jgi:predicted component of type VI protein secretion system
MNIYRLKGTSGSVINQSWTLAERNVVGSGSECEIRIESDAFASAHAVVEIRDGRIIVRRLEDGGEVLVNGESIHEKGLDSGDEIRIGNCRWMLQAPGLKPEKVLTEEAVRRRSSFLPWMIVGILSALALLAWKLGYLPF